MHACRELVHYMRTPDAYTCTRTRMPTHAYIPFHDMPSSHSSICVNACQAMLTGVYQVTVMRDASRLTLPMLEMQLEEEAVGKRMN